jgi:hypothetical protein
MVNKLIQKLYIMLISSLILSLPAMSYSPFLDQSYEIYNVRNRCEMCHNGTKLNSFGSDFFVEWKKNKNIEESFFNIEKKDSDGDGFLNILEIKSMTLPGDKTSTPTDKKTFNLDLFRNTRR